jgi:hypothetical protein
MIYSAGDLGIEIDFGTDQPGAILQRKDKGYWHDYLIDGKPVTNPIDVETLPNHALGKNGSTASYDGF